MLKKKLAWFHVLTILCMYFSSRKSFNKETLVNAVSPTWSWKSLIPPRWWNQKCVFLQYYSSVPTVFTVLFEGQLFWSLQIFEAFLYYLLISFIMSCFSIRRSWRSCVCRQSSHVVALDVFACLLPGLPFTFSTSSAVWEVWIGWTRTLTLVLNHIHNFIQCHTCINTENSAIYSDKSYFRWVSK